MSNFYLISRLLYPFDQEWLDTSFLQKVIPLVQVISEKSSETARFVTVTSQDISYVIYFLTAHIPKSPLYSLDFLWFDSYIGTEMRKISLSDITKCSQLVVNGQLRSSGPTDQNSDKISNKMMWTQGPQISEGRLFTLSLLSWCYVTYVPHAGGHMWEEITAPVSH